MCNYPAKMAVIVPNFIIADENSNTGSKRQYVFLHAFSVFKIERAGRGFKFDEVRQIDEVGDAGVDLLDALTAELDVDTSIAGNRLDQLVGSLIRVPLHHTREAACRPALLRLQAALTNEVQDSHWYADRPKDRSLESLAERYDLTCEWGRPDRQGNSAMLERQLSARAQAIWLAIALELLPKQDQRRALADYDAWRTANAII